LLHDRGREPAAPASGRAAQAVAGTECWYCNGRFRKPPQQEAVGDNSKTDVVVTVVRVIVIAIGATHVPAIVVVRSTAQNTRSRLAPATPVKTKTGHCL